jgi:hypothetical protein
MVYGYLTEVPLRFRKQHRRIPRERKEHDDQSGITI